MSNKLQEMKKRLLMTKKDIKEGPEIMALVTPLGAISPQIVTPEPAKQEDSIKIIGQIVQQPVQSQNLELIKQKFRQQPQDVQQGQIYEQNKENLQDIPVQISQKKNQQNEAEPLIEIVNPIIQQKQQIQNKQNPPIDNGQRLNLIRADVNISLSIDEEIRPAEQNNENGVLISQLIRNANRQDNQNLSKVQQKKQKIVLKQLMLVNKCISNLKGAVKGLQIISAKMKENPFLKTKLKNFLIQLKEAFKNDNYNN